MIKKKIHARETREDMLWKRKKKRTYKSIALRQSFSKTRSSFILTYKRVTRTRAHLLPGQVSQRELRATVAMQDIQESQRRARFKGSKRNGPLFAFCKKRTRASNFARPKQFRSRGSNDKTSRISSLLHTHVNNSLGNRSATRDKFSRFFFYPFWSTMLC